MFNMIELNGKFVRVRAAGGGQGRGEGEKIVCLFQI